jgi:hypothetical protein
MKPVVRLTIVGNSRAPLCQVECGPNWSLPETLGRARQEIRQRFGHRIEIDYVDAARREKSLPAQGDASYPLLMVDGRVRLAGQFDLRQVIDVAEAELEMVVRQ